MDARASTTSFFLVAITKKGTQASAFCVPSMDRLFLFLIYLFIGIFCRKLNLRLLYFIFSFYVSYTNGL